MMNGSKHAKLNTWVKEVADLCTPDSLYWCDGSKACIQIADNGKGIPNDQVYKIFTPFYTTKEEGSGLGLAFAQRIVKDHGGAISVTSIEGSGATFLVTLPLHREAEVAPTAVNAQHD